ncbi:hypothetical protein OG481_31400 [Streptomyces longwoodensis]|uniref:hypothetical protein n=1 Tax=Streptomyces longwoodensis TaxID=68231 RepID=UPI002DDC6981|nr:hypothetical protein [Streptomyces longwoodensis]WRY92724.1 hypothetical protein OG481_31400 [Streptomyces longwoodensis]
MPKSRSAFCVESGTPPRNRLGGAEAVVIIVIVATAAILVALEGLTVPDVLQLLISAGLIAVLLVGLVCGTPVRSFGALLRVLLAPSA